MIKPPSQIDDFVVVEYGFLHEPALPVGYEPPKGSGRVLEPMQNFALCTSEGVDGFYLLCCTRSWAYMTYSYSELKKDAKKQVSIEFGKDIDLWHVLKSPD